MVPQKARKHRDFLWLGKNMMHLQEKHAGEVVAVVNKHASFGKNAIEAYNKSRKLFPDQEPVFDVVPSKDCLIL